MIHVTSFEAASKALSPARPLYLAIGMFDGVHLGHHSVIEAARRLAQHNRGLVAVLTFWPHPSRLFQPENPTLMILNPEQKKRRLAASGVDMMIELPFDARFAATPAEDFLPMLLVQLPMLKHLFVGENFRYGVGRSGDVEFLIDQGRALGIHVYSGNRVRSGGEAISSTRIRSLIVDGSIRSANQLLGYTYESEGRVVPGKQNGTKIGFPTLNLVWNPDLRPRFGVYCVSVSAVNNHEVEMRGVANYGLRPTVGDLSEPLLEVHVLDGVPECSYGDILVIRWHLFLRPEKKFPDFAALAEQIECDVRAARAFHRLED